MTAVELAELIEKQQRRLVRLYMKAYGQLLDRLQRQHLAGLSEAHTISLLRDIEDILEQLNVNATEWIEETFPQVYRGGSEEALEEIYRRYGEVPFQMNMAFGAVHQQAVERLAYDTFTDLAGATKNVSDRLKRSVRLAAERVFPTGVATGETRIQMTKRLVEALQKEGFTQYLDERNRRIKLADYKDVIGAGGRPLEFKPGQFQSAFLEENWVGFVDKAGRRWDLFNYAEMLTRTKVLEAENRGTEDRLVANGLDLVQISTHICDDWCTLYAGKVFSISGTHPVYPPLAQIPNGGCPMHPRCRHVETPFIEKFHSAEELEAGKTDPALLGKNKADGTADHVALMQLYRENPKKLESEQDASSAENAVKQKTVKRGILDLTEYTNATSVADAEKFAETKLGLKSTDYTGMNLDVANMFNREVQGLFDVFGNANASGYLKGVRVMSGKGMGSVNFIAAYSPPMKEVFLLKSNVGYKSSFAKMGAQAADQFSRHFWSTGKAEHVFRHEVGHAIHDWLAGGDAIKTNLISALRSQAMNDCGITVWDISDTKEHKEAAGKILSYYALRDDDEFVAEAIAEYIDGNPREMAKKVVEILLRK